MAQQLLKAEKADFVITSLDLNKLLKSLNKSQKDAVATLVNLLKSEDDNIKIRAATKLLEFNVAIAKEINDDSLRRLIAQAKLSLPNGARDADRPKSLDGPIVDFTNIQEF